MSSGITFLNNVLLLITQSHLSTAQDSSSFKRLDDTCMFMYVTPRVRNFIGGGEYPTFYTAVKHIALSYDAIRY